MIWVSGDRGMLGTALRGVLDARGLPFVGSDREVSILDEGAMRTFAAEKGISAIINCAAYTAVDKAEDEVELCTAINAEGPVHIGRIGKEIGARVIHISTDYVFDGSKKRPYVEDDRPHPINAYGVSKLSGEHYAFAYLQDALVIRTCGVFGPEGIHTAHGNFVESMLRNAHAGRPLRVVTDTIASPTFAPALAEKAVAMAGAGASGLYHVGGGSPISWFDFAQLIFDVSQIEASLESTTRAEYASPAARPHFSALSNEKMEADGFGKMPTLREAMVEYFDRRETVLRKGTLTR